MRQKFKCKEKDCDEYVTFKLNPTPGVLLNRVLDAVTIKDNTLTIQSSKKEITKLLDHNVLIRLVTDREDLNLNIREESAMDAYLTCPLGHTYPYQVIVKPE